MTWKAAIVGVALLGLLGAGVGYVLAFAPSTPRFEGERGVKLPRGSSFETVIDSLDSAGLLARPAAFRLFGGLTGWGRQVKPGYYRFAAGASHWEILDKIRKGRQDGIRVTIPPGVRPGVLAAVLRRDLDLDSTAFVQALRDPALAADLGTDTLHLFGHMRPNTFEIFWTTSPAGVVRRLKREMDAYFTEARRAQAQAQNLTPEDVLTLASIVEWEARLPAERPRIAGLYLNRLRDGWPLQADPTVQYALLRREGGRLRRLLFADYQIEDPYNTYRFRGLPPGPINNPSESSIQAVLNPERHDYYYMVADGSGAHVFSRTLSEHNAAAQRYYALMQLRRRESE